jgi:hypothetical protein
LIVKKVPVDLSYNLSFNTAKSLFLYFNLPLLQNQVCANNALPDILYIVYDSFEVRSCIVRSSNEYVVSFPRARSSIEGCYGNKPVRLDQQDS